MAYPYQKHIWVTREIIRREYLQNISDGIYDEQQERLLAEGVLEQAISDEETRAKGAENALDLAIQAETTRAQGAESDLEDLVEAEETRATQAESDMASDILSLDTRISNEYIRATSAESALGTRVSNLETTATRAYKAAGSVLFADLPALAESRQGFVYNIRDDFTTTSDFIEGAGKDYPAGTDVAIVAVEGTPITYKYNVMSGFVDTSDFIKDTDYATTSSAGIVKPDGTTTSVNANGVISVIGGGSGSGGHTILDSNGTALTQENNLQFMDSIVTDDSTNGKTIVRPSEFRGTQAQWDALSASEQAKYTSRDITDDFNGVPIDSVPTEGSTNAVSSGGVYDALQDVDAVIAPMLNVLGAKNLLLNTATNLTISGLTFVVNSDGSVTVNGTATETRGFTIASYITIPYGRYILSGCPENGSLSSYCLSLRPHGASESLIDFGEGVEIDLNESIDYVNLVIFSGTTVSNLTFYPMIRPASIKDDTYVPYSRTNQELGGEADAMLNVLGAKNLLPNNAITQTDSGLTYTVANDGRITVSGTATKPSGSTTLGTSYFIIDRFSPSVLKKGTYIFSGLVNVTVPASDLSIGIVDVTTDTVICKLTSENPKQTFTLADDTSIYVNLWIKWGTTISTVVYPMVRPASIVDDTYVPYAMTNRQLSIREIYPLYDTAQIVRYGKLATLSFIGVLPSGTTAPTNTDTTVYTITNPRFFPKKVVFTTVSVGGNTNKFVLIGVNTNGNIVVYNYTGASVSYLFGSLTYEVN